MLVLDSVLFFALISYTNELHVVWESSFCFRVVTEYLHLNNLVLKELSIYKY